MVAPVELVDVSASEENTPLDLMRLNYAFSDAMLSILERLDGKALCTCACVCRDLSTAAHDEALWSSLAHELKPDWTSSTNSRFAEEPTWRYVLRVRAAMLSSSAVGWKRLDDHRNGCCPYLAEIGTVVSGKWIPDRTRLGSMHDCNIKYGAICELVHLEAAREGDGSVSHRTYKAVAEEMAKLAADARTASPEDLHMVIREIYKSCYTGFGMADGAALAGMGFGETGTLEQVIARKGVVRRVSREGMGVTNGRRSSKEGMGKSPVKSPAGSPTLKGAARGPLDESMRQRLETSHNFMSLVRS